MAPPSGATWPEAGGKPHPQAGLPQTDDLSGGGAKRNLEHFCGESLRKLLKCADNKELSGDRPHPREAGREIVEEETNGMQSHAAAKTTALRTTKNQQKDLNPFAEDWIIALPHAHQGAKPLYEKHFFASSIMMSSWKVNSILIIFCWLHEIWERNFKKVAIAVGG